MNKEIKFIYTCETYKSLRSYLMGKTNKDCGMSI